MSCAHSFNPYTAITGEQLRCSKQPYVPVLRCPAHQHFVAPHAAATAAVAAVGAADMLGQNSLQRLVTALVKSQANQRAGTQLEGLLLECVVTLQESESQKLCFRRKLPNNQTMHPISMQKA
jgi:hypothetical protein